MLKQGRKTPEEKKLYCTVWTHVWIPPLREVDLEHSAVRGANRTKALVSLYPFLKLEKVTPNLQILCSSAYQSKPFRNTRSTYAHGWAISGVVTTKDKTK